MPTCHGLYSKPAGTRALVVMAAVPNRPLSLTLLSLQPAGTHSSSVMASWQLSQTLTSNSKPIRGMEERLELHLPQTAFPHLRQWCWKGREHRLATVPATRPNLPRRVGSGVVYGIRHSDECRGNGRNAPVFSF